MNCVFGVFVWWFLYVVCCLFVIYFVHGLVNNFWGVFVWCFLSAVRCLFVLFCLVPIIVNNVFGVCVCLLFFYMVSARCC